MSWFRINFLLKPLYDIIPWGDDEHNKSLSWFGMTDGELWITVGEQTIYEYSDAARKFWDCDIRHNDYQLSRFLEDLSEIFDNIRESIPQEFYNKSEELRGLFEKWNELHSDDDEEAFYIFCDKEYLPLTEWFYDRVFDSGHLVGGPYIGCFRCDDVLKIQWWSSFALENGECIWTSRCGAFELPYSDFTKEVNRFFNEFFEKMDAQVAAALAKDWGGVFVNKRRLADENTERKEGFKQRLALLDNEQPKTDWSKLYALYDKMCRELFRGER